MKSQETPFKHHVFVCTNSRGGARKSCADNGGVELAGEIKKAFKAKDLPPKTIRVSRSLCLGMCEHGPNVAVYPEGKVYSGVTLIDVPAIVDDVIGEELLKRPEQAVPGGTRTVSGSVT